MTVLELVLTLVGAGAGAALRYTLGGWVNYRLGPGFPWGTLAVNVLGSCALGFLEGAAPGDKALLLVLGSGVIAGFTTFSTLMLETLNLASAGQFGRAIYNIAANVAIGLSALLVGLYLGSAV